MRGKEKKEGGEREGEDGEEGGRSGRKEECEGWEEKMRVVEREKEWEEGRGEKSGRNGGRE